MIMNNYRRFAIKLFIILFAWMTPILSLNAQNTGIIPTPQRVEMQNGYYDLPAGKDPVVFTKIISEFPVDTNADQGYILEILPDKIEIQAINEIGLFYGQQSVKQLLRYYKKQSENASFVHVPCMRIVDYPLLKYRGWMDDISRGPIPNMTFLKSFIETMAEYKMNFFNLYTEHVFKLDRYPDIAPTDGLTAAEIKELEDYAAQYHIEFFGNQQCLAHAEKTLRIPFYQDMADTKANYNPGVPKTYDFLKYQLETVAQAYQSPFFNIDCDETEALGNGKAHDYVANSGNASQVYAEHIQKMYDILKPMGKHVMMWGDIAAKDSAITAQLPKDMLMIVWSYAPSDSYVNMMEPFVKQGLDFMVAPGMSMWSTVFPSYDTYTKNIANLVRDGYQHGALGMMNTAWDDSGESLINSAWHGMAWAAEMAWKPIQNTGLESAENERYERLKNFDSNFECQFLGYDLSKLFAIKRLEHTGIPDFFHTSALYDNVLDFYETKVSDGIFQLNVNQYASLDMLKRSYEDLIREVDPNLPVRYTAMARIAHYVCAREQVVAQKNILRYMLYRYLQGDKSVTIKANNGVNHTNRTVILNKQYILHEINMLLENLHQAKNEYMIIWDEECRPYSRDIVERRFDQVAQELLNVPYHVFTTTELNEKGEAVVFLKTLFDDVDMFYSLDGRKPQIGDTRYVKPLTINRSTMLRVVTKNEMGESVESENYILVHKALQKISKLNVQYSNYRSQYEAGGKMALADGLPGGSNYADGKWQGYWGTDIDVEFDFGKTIQLSYFKTRFFQDIYDWIMSPNTVEIYTSKNGKDYVLNTTLTLDNVDYNSSSKGVYTVQSDQLSIKARYVRVVVKNAGGLPEWHQAKGQPSYIFCDEMIFE